MLWLIPVFALTALLYAAIGFGGGSSYIAFLALAGYPYEAIAVTALLCNIVVVSGGTYQYARHGYIRKKLLLPFVLSSLPFALFGGLTPVGKTTLLMVLSISLLFSGLHLLFTPAQTHRDAQGYPTYKWSLPLGVLLGFVSGLVGIGGGIFLSPLLHLKRWGTAKEIAATSSCFILINSVAGLIGQILKHGHLVLIQTNGLTLYLVATVAFFGFIGSKISCNTLNSLCIKRLTGLLIVYVALRIQYQLHF